MNLKTRVNPFVGYLSLLGMVFVFFVVFYVANKTNTAASSLLKDEYSYTRVYKGAILKTSEGDITLEFLQEKAPQTVKNFVLLAEKGFFNETKFHRVIKDFIIQGGDPNTKGNNEANYGKGNPGYFFKDEITDVKMTRGVVAMANAGPNTNGSQFFILLATEAPWLQDKHTIFAYVKQGMDVVDSISLVQVSKDKIPLLPVVLTAVELY